MFTHPVIASSDLIDIIFTDTEKYKTLELKEKNAYNKEKKKKYI